MASVPTLKTSFYWSEMKNYFFKSQCPECASYMIKPDLIYGRVDQIQKLFGNYLVLVSVLANNRTLHICFLFSLTSSTCLKHSVSAVLFSFVYVFVRCCYILWIPVLLSLVLVNKFSLRLDPHLWFCFIRYSVTLQKVIFWLSVFEFFSTNIRTFLNQDTWEAMG